MGEASIDELFDGKEGIFECIQVRKRDILGSIWSPRPASRSNVLFACLRCSGLYEFTNRSRAINSGLQTTSLSSRRNETLLVS
jgi:hypothetical protein